MYLFFYVNIFFLVFYQADSDAIFRLLKLYVKDYIVLTYCIESKNMFIKFLSSLLRSKDLHTNHSNQIRPKEKKIFSAFNQ